MSPYTQQPQPSGPHMQAGQQSGADRGQQQQPQHAGVHATLNAQPGGPQAIPQQGGQIFTHPLQYPAAVYPPLQVLPGNIPGNVYVSNVTANVNVHGWHSLPTQFQTYLPAQDVPVAQSPGHDTQVSLPPLSQLA